jgi:hypothetical protein
VIGGLEADLWKIRAERYSTAVLQYPRYCSRGGGLRGRAARVGGA